MSERQVTHWEGCTKAHPECARSDLARKVLSQCKAATRGTFNDKTAASLTAEIRDLFTREGIQLGE